MKSIPIILGMFAASSILAAAPDSATAPKADPNATNSAAPAEQATPASAAVTNDAGTNMLRMNFHAASLDMVLNYLSEAAGFIINIKPGTSVRGKVDVWSNDPLTRDEAVNLLDTVLIQNNLAAIRNGKTLTIVNRDEAKTQNIPVIPPESDPEKIPITDRIVTQIIPVRFVEVGQLLKDLQPLVSMNTTMTANEAGNSLVITDTQANIHKVAEIIHAIDMGAEDFTQVKVFRLRNADPTETADMLTNLFPDDTKTGNTQSPFAGGGGFGRFARIAGFGGPPGAGGQTGGGSNNQNQRIKKRNRVIAVADQRTASVVVSASRDLMDQIEEVITGLDGDPKGRQIVRVYHLENADPQETLPVLQDIFQKNTTQQSRNSGNQNNNALLNRSNTQNQQNNSTSRSSTTPGGGGRGGTGAPSFP